jgi:hypothetical protein
MHVGQCHDFKKVAGQLLASYMQNPHNLMPQTRRRQFSGEKKPGTLRIRLFRRTGFQAMNTAMKARRKIKTAPATGSTIGINGTMDSTTSWGSSLCFSWGAWDMMTPD